MSALIKRLWALIVIFIVGEAFVVVVLKAQFGPAVDEQVEEEAPEKNPRKGGRTSSRSVWEAEDRRGDPPEHRWASRGGLGVRSVSG